MFNEVLDSKLTSSQIEQVAAFILFAHAQDKQEHFSNDVKNVIKIMRALPQALARELAFEVLVRAKYACDG